MKELSIEQKAKRYDELKVTAQGLEHDGCFDKITLFDLFPELEVSEDESIRKELIQFFSDKDEEDYEGMYPRAQIIAWLEKQGEQKPNYCHHEVNLSDYSEEYRKGYYDGWNNCNMQHSQCRSELDDVVKCLINGMKFYYEDNKEATWGTNKWSMPVKHIIEVLEKQGEQNPTQEIEPTPIFRIGDVLKRKGKDYTFRVDRIQGGYYHSYCNHGAFFPIEEQGNWELVEQKPAFSEEDKDKYEAIVAIIRQQYDGTNIEEKKYYNTLINWLKSLKDRVQPQPKQEKFELADWLKEHKGGIKL